MKLRKHQKKQNKLARKKLKEVGHLIYGAPTGYGKSVAALDMIMHYVKKGKRVLILAPRITLVDQLYETFAPMHPVKVQGSSRVIGNPKTASVVVTIPQTANRRLEKDPKFFGDIDVVIVDECHMMFNLPGGIPGTGIKHIHNAYWNSAKWIGFSATPITAAGYRLEGWDHTIYEYDTAWLIKKGWLAKFNYYAVDAIDTSSIKIDKHTHDYKEKDMDRVVSTPSSIDAVKDAVKKYAKGKKALIFAASIAHAELLTDEIGKKALVIHSRLSRNEIKTRLDAFRRGDVKILINVSMLTTGFDDPSVQVLLIARPIGSISLALQVYGRVLRAHDDIPYVDIVDLCNVHQDTLLPDDPVDWNKERTERSDGSNDEVAQPVYKCDKCGAEFTANKRRFERIYEHDLIIVNHYCPECGVRLAPNSDPIELNTPNEDLKKIKTTTDIDYSVQYNPVAVMREIILIKNSSNIWAKPTNLDFSYFIARTCVSCPDKKKFKTAIYAYKQGIWKWDKAWKVAKDMYFKYKDQK